MNKEPLNSDLNPPLLTAADGQTTLYRHYVLGVVYARSKQRADELIEQADIVFDAAQVLL